MTSANGGPYTLKWGILGTGWISSMFVADLILPRDDLKDVVHKITAVGSREEQSAQAFINKHLKDVQGVRPVWGYQALCDDSDVDIVYVGTLHHLHHRDAKMAIEAGKHVLLEKPACLNVAEWDDLCGLAQKKGVFLMEGMWTRFQPGAEALRKALHEDKVIGEIRSVQADFSMPFAHMMPDEHRSLNPALAGGPLLDLGPYVLQAALLALYLSPENKNQKPTIQTSMIKARTGVDLTTTLVLGFPAMQASANLTVSLNYRTPTTSSWVITGTTGEIVLRPVPNRITDYIVRRRTDPDNWFSHEFKDEVVDLSFPGAGFYFEADAAARSIRDGKLEPDLWRQEDTRLVMSILDTARAQGGYVYPDGLEAIKL